MNVFLRLQSTLLKHLVFPFSYSHTDIRRMENEIQFPRKLLLHIYRETFTV